MDDAYRNEAVGPQTPQSREGTKYVHVPSPVTMGPGSYRLSQGQVRQDIPMMSPLVHMNDADYPPSIRAHWNAAQAAPFSPTMTSPDSLSFHTTATEYTFWHDTGPPLQFDQVESPITPASANLGVPAASTPLYQSSSPQSSTDGSDSIGNRGLGGATYPYNNGYPDYSAWNDIPRNVEPINVINNIVQEDLTPPPNPPRGSKEVKCKQCGQIFTGIFAKGNEHRHVKTVHSKLLYTCLSCDKKFRRSDARKVHFRKSHREGNDA